MSAERLRRVVVLSCVFFSLAAPGLLAAQPPAAPAAASSPEDDQLAREHFEAGRAYFARARYDDAAREFTEAYRLSHRLPMLLNLARALAEADRDAEAVAALETWLELAPEDDPSRADVNGRRVRLRAELETARAEAEAARASEPPPEPAPAAEGATSEASRRPATFWVGVGALGVGGAMGAVSLGTGLAAHHLHEDLADACGSGGASCPPDRAGDIDRGDALAKASTALTFVGIAAAGAGVTLMVIGRHRDGDDDGATATLTPWFAPGGAGGQLRLSF